MPLRRVVDVTGLEVTLSDPKALLPFNESVRSLVSGYGNCGGPLHEAIAGDPEFLFAQIFLVLEGLRVTSACYFTSMSFIRRGA